MATTGAKREGRGGRRDAGKLPRLSRKIFRRPRRASEGAPSSARASARTPTAEEPSARPRPDRGAPTPRGDRRRPRSG